MSLSAKDAGLLERAKDASALVHFVGVAGAGMSALAQVRALSGGLCTGSDRGFDAGLMPEARRELERVGVRILPQDGRGAEQASLVVVSTAVEGTVPDHRVGRERGTLVHRADLLAWHVHRHLSAAIAGTSGKSTVTAMVFHVLKECGHDPGLITGGELLALRAAGLRGNAWIGAGPLVIEADESDGTLVRYSPQVGTILNLHRDHQEPAETLRLFRQFAAGARHVIVSDDPQLRDLSPGAVVFGFGSEAAIRGTGLTSEGWTSRFNLEGIEVRVPMPGEHNARNALLALGTAEALGVPWADAAGALATFRGVHRRFQRVGDAQGVTLVDDYAHNPTKLAAALRTAQALSPRVWAVFQPHGFGPTRFMRAELLETLRATLRPHDRLWLAKIYYAGGTAAQDVSSEGIAETARALGLAVFALPHREELAAVLRGRVRPGDLVLVLGARDPSLPEFARGLLQALRSE